MSCPVGKWKIVCTSIVANPTVMCCTKFVYSNSIIEMSTNIRNSVMETYLLISKSSFFNIRKYVPIFREVSLKLIVKK